MERQWCQPGSEATAAAFSSDGRYLAAGCNVWRLDLNNRVLVLTGAGRPRSLAFSPDAKAILTTASSVAQLWKLPPLEADPWQANAAGVVRPRLRRGDDGRTLVSEYPDGRLQLWDGRTTTALGPAKGYGEPDKDSFISLYRNVVLYGNVVASVQGMVMQVTEFGSDKVIASLPHAKNVTRAEFSPDGKTLVTADEDGGLYFWDTASYRQRFPTVKTEGPISSMSFNGLSNREGNLAPKWQEDQ